MKRSDLARALGLSWGAIKKAADKGMPIDTVNGAMAWRHANPQFTRKDCERRSSGVCDAHVIRYFELYTARDRKTWECPVCGRMVRSFERYRCSNGHVSSKHCGCSTHPSIPAGEEHLSYKKRPSNKLRRRSAEQARRKAVAENQGRVFTSHPPFHTAHVKAYRKHLIGLGLKEQEARRSMCAHVDEFKRAADNSRSLEYWNKNKHRPSIPVRRIEKRKEHRENLTDQYIVRVLTNSGTGILKKGDIPQALIELKRQHLMLERLIHRKKEANEKR